MKCAEFAPAEVHFTALRYQQALACELLLHTHGARRSQRAHLSRLMRPSVTSREPSPMATGVATISGV